MPFTATPIDGLKIFTPRVFGDERGHFFESYNEQTFREAGIKNHFVQDNQAASTQGVLRGMHFQTGGSAQAKLVRCTEGAVYDVAVDLRPGSPTLHQWFGLELSADNKKQLFVPRGFAHGYLVLTPTATFAYKCDNFYDRTAEGGLRWDDPGIGIEWPELEVAFQVNERDQGWELVETNN